MNYQDILIAVLSENKSLVFLANSFGSSSFGAYIKSSNGDLKKVHGKSASKARELLISAEGVVRSYGRGKMSSGSKQKSVYMTEFSKFA